MKIVSSKQMAFLESQALRNGSTDSAFMEEAGKGIALLTDSFVKKHACQNNIILLCGKGNNGGDAYVAGVYLLQKGYSVKAYQISSISSTSPLCQKNHHLFREKGGIAHEVNQLEEIKLPSHGVILDALFGTGFHGSAKEPYASVIALANSSSLPILSIDIPSGLRGDTGIVEGKAIQATETFFLGLPKTGFFLQDGWNHTGKLHHIDFGLPQSYIEESEADLQMLSPSMMHPMLPTIVNTRHKYQAGYIVGLAGSPGMPGAALLSSSATLRSGAGITKLLYPAGMEEELSTSPYELIKVAYQPSETSKIIDLLNQASAVFIGPGLGRSQTVRDQLKVILPELTVPTVIDADALTIIGEDRLSPPKTAILTPHIGEMIRLLERCSSQPHSKEFLKCCQDYVDEKRVTLVLKGGPSFIFHPDEIIRVNPYGDPGMATAGSGDVLTGVIAAFLSQGLLPHDAASLGVFIHGVSGEFAAEAKTSYGLIASDIIDCLPKAFSSLSYKMDHANGMLARGRK